MIAVGDVCETLEDAFEEYEIGVSFDDVLCGQHDRQVGRDNCISWSHKSLQISEQKHRRALRPRDSVMDRLTIGGMPANRINFQVCFLIYSRVPSSRLLSGGP